MSKWFHSTPSGEGTLDFGLGVAVWLDDIRPMPSGYDVHVKTAWEAIEALQTGLVGCISLDNDLGPPEAGEGYDVAKWIEEQAFLGNLPEICVYCHSANPRAVINIDAAILAAKKFWRKEHERPDYWRP